MSIIHKFYIYYLANYYHIMSELLEVDYGNEDLQNEIKNQSLRIEVDREIIKENTEEIKTDKDLNEKKNIGKLNKDPIFFVLRLSEEILSSSLSSNYFIISEDVYKSYQKYFEVIIKDYIRIT
jgi:hypothetical protein